MNSPIRSATTARLCAQSFIASDTAREIFARKLAARTRAGSNASTIGSGSQSNRSSV